MGEFDHAVDEDGSVWRRYEIRTQPAFVFIDDAGETVTHVGALGPAGLTERIESIIG